MEMSIIPFNQAELNNLVRELRLSKECAQLLGLRLEQRNLLESCTEYNFYGNRQIHFQEFFTSDEKFSQVYCKNISNLIEVFFNYSYNPKDWKLYIDLCKKSFKAFLLSKYDNCFIPIGYSSISVHSLLAAINYQSHLWSIYGDFKIIGQVLGLQERQPCNLCLWDNFADNQHYVRRNWQVRQDVCKDKEIHVYFLPFHIRSHLVKKFVKALDRKSKAFTYLYQTFDRKNMNKLKAGLFDSSEIRNLINYTDFDNKLSPLQFSIWSSIKIIIEKDFSKISQSFIDELMENFHKLGVRMSVKMHFLHAHLDYLHNRKENKEEEIIIEEIMGKYYRGRWNVEFIADICWRLKKDNPRRETSYSFPLCKKQKIIDEII